MFNVKKKSTVPTRLPEPVVPVLTVEDTTDSVNKGVEFEAMGTPPLTPGSDTAGDASTDEQSVDSVEEPTVEEAGKDDAGEDESQEETNNDDTYKEDSSSSETSQEDEGKEEESKDDSYEPDTSQEEASKDEDRKVEGSKAEVLSDEAGPPPTLASQASALVDQELDAEEVYMGHVPSDVVHLAHGTGFKLFFGWVIFWTIALGGGLIAYYFNAHQQILAARLSGSVAEDNLLLLPRERWDDAGVFMAKPMSYTAQRVVVMQTDTEGCNSVSSCTKLLNAMKRKEGMLQFNFFLASDGCIYEGLGWQEPSPLYPETRTMVVAFIGDYETMAPSAMQLTQLQALLEASEQLNYLNEEFTILGRKQTVLPSKLFAYMAAFEKWDKDNTDTNEQYIDTEFEQFPIFNV